MSKLFRKDKYIRIKGIGKNEKTSDKTKVVCTACGRELNKADVIVNHYICTACGSYFRVRTKNRIHMVCEDRKSVV